MAFIPTDPEQFYEYDRDTFEVKRGPLSRKETGYGEISSHDVMWTGGFALLWQDIPLPPDPKEKPFASIVLGPVTVNQTEKRCEQVGNVVDLSPEEKRETLAFQIEEQVSEPTARQVANDPHIEKDVVREEAAAEDKRIELQDTADEDLDSFDPAIQVAPVQNGVEYSRVAGIILELEAWVGLPDNKYGPVVELEVQSGLEDQGADARMNITRPDKTVIPSLTFTQRAAPEDNIWDLNYRQEDQWPERDGVAYMELLWGVGSVPVSRKLKLNGYGKRKAQSVRYGVAGGSTKKRGDLGVDGKKKKRK